LEEKRQTLLAETMAPGFWEDSVRAAATLRVFRAVDAELSQLDALREACQAARRRAREAKGEVQLAAAAGVVEKAAREVQLFEARIRSGAQSGDADEAWLDICASAEGEAHEAWVKELMHLYLGWAEKRRFEGKVVAVGEDPARVVLHVAGPGVYSFLSSERGTHRRVDDQTRVAAVVRLYRPVPAGKDDENDRVRIDVKDIKRRSSKFADKVGCEASARDDATGRSLVLLGTGTSAELKPLARAVLEGQGGVSDEARRYFVGRGARVEDPRTGAFTPRVKDVLRGEIDQFVAAWVARAPELAQ
jgi:protein subunit release factor A